MICHPPCTHLAVSGARDHAERLGLEGPTTPHAWGALANAARERGIIRWTGRYEKAHAKRTHRHPVQVWVAR